MTYMPKVKICSVMLMKRTPLPATSFMVSAEITCMVEIKLEESPLSFPEGLLNCQLRFLLIIVSPGIIRQTLKNRHIIVTLLKKF